jgi:hypothetical protein
VLSGLGRCYEYSGDHEGALTFRRREIALAERLGNPANMATEASFYAGAYSVSVGAVRLRQS